MSTKIYDAYQSTTTDICKLFKYFKQLKQTRVDYYNSIILDTIKIEDIKQLEKMTTETPYLKYKFSESVVVYPYKDRVFVQFFGNNDLMKIVNKCKLFKDFHYQNQTDKPERLTEKEWRNREKIWDNIFKGNDNIPAQSGLVYDFMTYDMFNMMQYKKIWAKQNKGEKSETIL